MNSGSLATGTPSGRGRSSICRVPTRTRRTVATIGLIIAVTTIASAAVIVAGGGVAVAAPPNDNRNSPVVIPNPLPATVTGDTSQATADPSDPIPSCSIGALAGTLWYSYTPAATSQVVVDLQAGAGTIPIAAFYTADASGNLTQQVCTVGGQASFSLTGGQTYLIMVGQYTGAGSPGPFSLTLSPGISFTATGVTFTARKKVPFTGTVATFTGPGGASGYTARIRWGDGDSSIGTIAQTATGGFAVIGTHTYKRVCDFAVVVLINQTTTGNTVKARSRATVRR